MVSHATKRPMDDLVDDEYIAEDDETPLDISRKEINDIAGQ